ncbi:FCD domain-containing protein [Vibrio profundum]|uniref:FCD domain-containing protein n=1 Tax=Vibrio profundum TaxID=2910247 RepID=UPI003D1042CC
MTFTHTEPKRLYQRVALKLQQQISAGQYRLGDRLPPEREISETMEISRSVVREAIIMLELQGWVEVRKGSGAYVVSESSVIQSCHVSPDTSDVGPFELLQARQVLESQIAGFAAMNVTKSDIDKLKQALKTENDNLASEHSDTEGDKMFHFTIAEASQNSVLSDIVKQLWRQREDSAMWHQLHSRITNQSYQKAWLDDHQTILVALQKRDPEAARAAMWQHLENVKETLLALSDVDDPNFDGYLFR